MFAQPPNSFTMSGLRVGLKKGYVTDKVAPKARPSRRKGVRPRPPRCRDGTRRDRSSNALLPPPLPAPQTLNKRVKIVREIISEVAGLAPYEKRVLDVIKVRSSNVGPLARCGLRAELELFYVFCRTHAPQFAIMHGLFSAALGSLYGQCSAIPIQRLTHTSPRARSNLPAQIARAPLQTGGANAEKRSYKLAKQRLGTHKRALHKREQLKALYARQRAMK
jgi:hypothetical protein